jgi:GNAT superfamily N-acetyltransferase
MNTARLKVKLRLYRKMGFRLFLHHALGRLWSRDSHFALRCVLATMPEVPAAKVKVDMHPFDPKTFTGFREEYTRSVGGEALEVFWREEFAQAGILTPYLTLGSDGSPAYTQWLITPDTQPRLEAWKPGRHIGFGPDEALVEGAYTFSAHRGQGIMIDGMAQLLCKARGRGLRAVYTAVATDNVPSLRGCARVGFQPDYVRVSTWRWGHSRTVIQPIDGYWQKVWDDAIGSRK